MLAAKLVVFVVLLQYVLFSTANPQPLSHEILVVYINASVSNTNDPLYDFINVTNPNINTLCTIYRNETNSKSFTSFYLTGYDPHISLEDNDIISFHHIIHINDLPLSCIYKLNNATATKETKNTLKYTRTHINFIPENNNMNKVFANDVDSSSLSVSQCPNDTWQYFIWSLKEWWLIYLCVICIGILIGALLMNIVIFCCWRSKKKKYATNIINDYKKQKMLKKQANGICDNGHNIHIVHQSNGKKYKYNAMKPEHIEYSQYTASRSNSRRKKHRKSQKRSKYAPVAMNDSNKDTDNRNKKRKKREKHLHPHRSASAEDISSEEEDQFLQVNHAHARMKSHSDPYNPHFKDRRSRSNRRKHRSKSRPHKSRSRSPYADRKGSAKKVNEHDEEYRFQGNGDILLHPDNVYNYDADKRRHSSKSKSKNRKKSKSNTPKKNDMKEDANVCYGNVTKKSIGINLAKMKAKNYEENRREARTVNQVGVKGRNSVEMHPMKPIAVTVLNDDDNIIHEGISADGNERKRGHFRTGGDSNYMGSLTNVNDEGMAAIENILSEMKEMNSRNLIENEESSSFTIKSADGQSSNDNIEEHEEDMKVDKDSDLLMTNNTKGVFHLPKAKTKGGWL